MERKQRADRVPIRQFLQPQVAAGMAAVAAMILNSAWHRWYFVKESFNWDPLRALMVWMVHHGSSNPILSLSIRAGRHKSFVLAVLLPA